MLTTFPIYKMQQREIHRHCNGKYKPWSYHLVDAYGYERVEQNHVDKIVHKMTATKASHVFQRNARLECEIGGHEEVAYETYNISHCIRKV